MNMRLQDSCLLFEIGRPRNASILLSTDSLLERKVRVKGGIIIQYLGNSMLRR